MAPPTPSPEAVTPAAAGERRAAPGKPSTLPHPTRRNIVWLSFQWMFRLIFTVWTRYRVRGLEHIPAEGGGLVLVNHQSFLDPLMVGLPLSRPISFVARDNLFRVPVIGWILRKTYVMPINREAASTTSIREAVGRIRHGFLVGIFPEGTRSDTEEVGPFKPGFLALLRRSNRPVYPVGVAGGNEVMPRGSLRFRPRRVCVVFGTPLETDELERLAAAGDEALIVELRARVVRCAREAAEWKRELDGKPAEAVVTPLPGPPRGEV